MKKIILSFSILSICELSFSAVANDMQPRGAGLNVQLPQSNSSQRDSFLAKMQQKLERDGYVGFGNYKQLMECFDKTGIFICYPELKGVLKVYAELYANQGISYASMDGREIDDIILDKLSEQYQNCIDEARANGYERKALYLENQRVGMTFKHLFLIGDVLKKCSKHCLWKKPVEEEIVSQNEQPAASASDSVALDQSEARAASQS